MKRNTALVALAGASINTEPAGPTAAAPAGTPTTRDRLARVREQADRNGEFAAGLLTVEEVLQRLPISRRTLAAWTKRRVIPSIQLPGSRRRLFHWGSLERALLRHQQEAAS